MSPLNYLWLCSIEHFVIVLPFNYVGWEGSYCFLFFLEADSSLRLVAWGRDVLKWDSEGFEFWWTRIIFLRILVDQNYFWIYNWCCIEGTYPCAGSVMGCVGIYFGNLEFQLYCVKNHASVWMRMTYIFCTEVPSACEFFTSTRKLLELSVFLLLFQSTQCVEDAFVGS